MVNIQDHMQDYIGIILVLYTGLCRNFMGLYTRLYSKYMGRLYADYREARGLLSQERRFKWEEHVEMEAGGA